MKRALPETRESLWRMVFGPLVWAAHFLLSYVTGAIVCAKFEAHDGIGIASLLVTLYTMTALALIAGSAGVHWRRQRHSASITPPHDAGSGARRQRFLGIAGLLLCGLSAVAVLYTAVVAAIIRSCG